MADRISLPVSRVTAIADLIRTLSGTDAAMKPSAMVTHLTTANHNVTTEAELIAEIMTALGGKTAGEAGLPENARVYYIGKAVNGTQMDDCLPEYTATAINSTDVAEGVE